MNQYLLISALFCALAMTTLALFTGVVVKLVEQSARERERWREERAALLERFTGAAARPLQQPDPQHELLPWGDPEFEALVEEERRANAFDR